MTNRPDRSTPGGAAYLDLRRLATNTQRPTDELHQLYALEGFLDRLTRSAHSEHLVLKGGVLLAAYSERRPTRDIDFAASQIQADHDNIRDIVNDILAINVEDGLEFDPAKTSVKDIRDLDAYPGVRSKISGTLATAKIRFHVDINIGDPLWPAPRQVELPRLLRTTPLQIKGYSVELVLAEKTVTALQRGTANTRWRDFVDIAALSTATIDRKILDEAIKRVAEHRQVTTESLSSMLDGYAVIAQPRWQAWRRKQQLTHTPEQFADLLKTVIEFTDPSLE